MRKLTKEQLWTFIITAVTMIFGFLTDNAGVLGLGAKGIAMVGFLRMVWQLYLSYTAQDVANFANELRFNASDKKKFLNPKDVKVWAKHVGTRPKDPPGGGDGDEINGG